MITARYAALAALAIPAIARARPRPRFEPTDLELERSGTAELDLQLGYAAGPARAVAPDFELDLGLSDRVELDLDGALSFSRDATLVDNAWLSAKVGLFDSHGARSWALGVQLGPKLPLAAGSRGVGAEAIILLGFSTDALHLVASAGGLYDPHDHTSPRPLAAEAGLDAEYELVPDRWSLLGELGGVAYHTSDPAQLAVSAGLQFSPTQSLDLSLVAVVGFQPGSDPIAILFGFSPKLAIW